MTRAGLKTNHLPDTNQRIAEMERDKKWEQKFRTILIAILKKCRIQLILFVLVRHCRQRQRGFMRICHCARLSLYSMSDRFWCGLLFQHFIFMYCRLLP